MAIKRIPISSKKENNLTKYLDTRQVEIETMDGRTIHNATAPIGEIKKIVISENIDISSDSDILTKHRQTLKVVCNAEEFENLDSARLFIDRIFKNNSFYSCNTIIGHTNYETRDKQEKGILFNKIYSHYNFKLLDYERLTRDSVIAEGALPSHLIGLYKNAYPDFGTSMFYYNMFNWNSDFSAMQITRKFPSNVNKNHKMFSHHENYNFSENYFQRYYNVNNFNNDGATIKNIFVNFDFPREGGNNVYDVPFYNSIYLHFDGAHGVFRKPYTDAGLSELLMKTVQSSRKTAITFNAGIDGQSVSYPAFDIVQATKETSLNDFIKDINDKKEICLYNPETSLLRFSNPHLIEDINKAVVFGHLKQIMKDNTLDFSSTFLKSGRHYSELVAYKIEKYAAGRGVPTQTFYFYNLGAAKDFIDSQVRFKVEYTYNIIGIYFVAGNSCSFGVADVRINNGEVQGKVDFIIEPSLKIIEVPITQKKLYIVEPPPLPPIVKIKNSKNKRHRIDISIEERQGIEISTHSRKKMKIIGDRDFAYKASLSRYIGNEYTYFSHIAANHTFEIYRSEEKPNSIRDFEGKLYYLLTSQDEDSRGNKKRSRLTFTDFIPHEKTYYYVFRSKTHNDNFSNVSPVYAVEKYQDADETMLKVNTIAMEEDPSYSMEISFRRFMNISIKDIHLEIGEKSYISPETLEPYPSANQSSLILGNETNEDSIWRYNDLANNYIKLRLESKNSGKKIDFNLIFNYNKPKNVN